MEEKIKWKIQRNKKCAIVCILFFVSLFSFRAVSTAGPPAIIHQQGRLKNAAGDLLGGTTGTNFCFRFSFYDSATVGGGTKLWPSSTPGTMTVNVKNGVFNASIGDTSAGGDTLDFHFQDFSSVYLNIEVAAQVSGSCSGVTFETLSPRPQFTSASYALNAGSIVGTNQSAIGTASPIAGAILSLVASSTTATPLVIQATTSQAVDLLRIQNAVGSALIFVNSTGAIFASSTLNVDGLSLLQGGFISNASSSVTNLFITNATSTNATSTNLTVTGGLTLTGATITGLSTANLSDVNTLAKLVSNQTFSGINIFTATTTFATTTIASSTVTNENVVNLIVNGTLGLPVNAVTDVMIPDSITASNYLLLTGGSLSGLTTLANGFISSASSSVAGSLNVSGNFNASSSLFVASGVTFQNLASCDTIDTNAQGVLTCGTDATGASAFSGQLFGSSYTTTNGSTTSSLRADGLFIATSTANALGLFSVDSSGNIFASGTQQIAGLSLFRGGFISSASSSVVNLSIVNTTSTNATSTNLAITSGLTVTGATITGLSTTNLSDTAALARIASNQTFSGLNIFSATTTFATTTMASSTVTNENVTNLSVVGTLGLPTNSITDAMVVDSITASNYLPLTGGTLSGLTTLQGGFVSNASSSIGAGLQVAGAVNASSTLLVNGLSILTNGFISSASSSIASSLNVTGNINASSSLFVANGVTFQNLTNCDTIDTNAQGVLTCGTDATGASAFTGFLTSPLYITDGSTTSTLRSNYLAIATSTSNLAGLFNVDSSGNIASSGTLSVAGLSTFTGGFNSIALSTFASGFISSASSSVGGQLLVSGSLRASSTLQVTGGVIFSGLTNCDTIDTNGDGLLSCGSDATGGGASFNGQLANGNNFFVTDGSTTSTLRSNFFSIATSTSNLLGLFHIDSSGNVFASGTARVSGLTVLAGGFIANASSSIGAGLQIAGAMNASSTLLVNGLSTLTSGFISSASSSIASSLNVSGNLNVSSSLFVVSSVDIGITGSTSTLRGGATSTFSGGVNITSGCFAMNGKCLSTPESAPGLASVQVFTSDGTWTRPARTSRVRVQMVGGGGGGGGGTAGDASGGGGGGGYSEEFIDVTATSSIGVDIGAGGAGGSSSGSNGATTTFGGASGGASVFLEAGFGFGGTLDSSGGSGGIGVGGNINIRGGRGGDGSGTAAESVAYGGDSFFGTGGKAQTGVTGCNSGTGYGAGGAGCAISGTGGNGTDGVVIVWEYATGTITGADTAEWYAVEAGVEPGDIVGPGENNAEFISALGQQQITVMEKATLGINPIGIVSALPYTIIGEDIVPWVEHARPVALSGRVPVNVSTENGPIRAGDRISLSSIPGIGAKAIRSGMTVGIALEAFDPLPNGQEAQVGKILVFTNMTYISVGLETENADFSFEIVTTTDNTLDLSHDTTGLVFNQVAIFHGGLKVDTIGAIGTEVSFLHDTIFFGRPYFNRDTAGSVIVEAGMPFADVTFETEYREVPSANVTIALDMDELAQTFFDEDVRFIVTNATTKGFRVRLNKVAPRDIRFSWTAFAISDRTIPISETVESPSISEDVQLDIQPETVAEIPQTDTEGSGPGPISEAETPTESMQIEQEVIIGVSEPVDAQPEMIQEEVAPESPLESQ